MELILVDDGTIARKNGFAASEGDYIILIDSNDWIEEGMFTLMMEKTDFLPLPAF